MLRTMTRSIAEGIEATVHEPSNEDYYHSRLLNKRVPISEDDIDLQEFFRRFCLIQTRTSSVKGMPFKRVSFSDSIQEIENEFKLYMSYSKAMCEEWLSLAIDVADFSPKEPVKEKEETKKDLQT